MIGQICDLYEKEFGIPGNAVYVMYRPISERGWNVVTFVFHDGTKITKTWEDKSRKWTDEMKAENYENLRRHKR